LKQIKIKNGENRNKLHLFGEQILVSIDRINLKIKCNMKQTITILDYPQTFSFTTITKLTPFNNDDPDVESCEVRRKLLLKNLKKYKIDSPCHDYTDYVVEIVYPTDDGEIWFLGS